MTTTCLVGYLMRKDGKPPLLAAGIKIQDMENMEIGVMGVEKLPEAYKWDEGFAAKLHTKVKEIIERREEPSSFLTSLSFEKFALRSEEEKGTLKERADNLFNKMVEYNSHLYK